MGTDVREVPISNVKVGKRRRKDVGDLSDLRTSIETVGLLHPIVLTKQMELVVGQRRLVAYKQMGRAKIPATVADNISDVLTALKAERDENLCRKDFTLEEAHYMQGAILAVEKPPASERKAVGQKSGGRGKKKLSPKLGESNRHDREATRIAAKAVGMSATTLGKVRAVVESGDKKLIDEMNRTGKANGVFRRLKVKHQSAALEAKPVPLPTGQFDVIVADPPWHYEKREADPSHRAALPYPSMSIDKIAALPIAKRAENDCVLWLWTTNSHLPEVWRIVQAWGFQYKTMLTWAKHKMGTGDWLRGQTEHCLLCVKGKPTIRLTNQTTLLSAKSGEHSGKPNEFYEMVEALCPGTKLEVFARKQRKGWVSYGDEVSG